MAVALTVPLLLVFLFAVIDLGRMAFLGAEVSTAVHAVCRFVEENPQAALLDEELRASALEASPSLESEGVYLSISARVGDQEVKPYEYRMYDGESEEFLRLPAQARMRPVEVVAEVQALYLTPLGTLFSQAQDSVSATFLCKARAVGVVDETVQGGLG